MCIVGRGQNELKLGPVELEIDMGHPGGDVPKASDYGWKVLE